MDFKLGCLLLATCALLSLAACEETKMDTVIEIAENAPLMSFENVSALYSENAVLRLKLEAPVQQQYSNRDESYPQGLYVEVYDSLGLKTTTVVADSGYHRMSDNSYRVMGNVVVKNLQEGQMLETSVLNWDMAKRIIFTDSMTPVKITTATEVIKGNGMRARQDFTNWEITGGVSGVFNVE